MKVDTTRQAANNPAALLPSLFALVGGTYRSITGASLTVTQESVLVANFAGTVTLTLGTVASRFIYVKTIQNQTVVSASANVVPLLGGAAGTAILAATAGKWAIIFYNGTNWEILASN
jgi:hypothetical protein